MARPKTDVGVIEAMRLDRDDMLSDPSVQPSRSRRQDPERNHSLARPVQDVSPGLVRAIASLASVQHAANYGKEIRRFLDVETIDVAIAKLKVIRGGQGE